MDDKFSEDEKSEFYIWKYEDGVFKLINDEDVNESVIPPSEFCWDDEIPDGKIIKVKKKNDSWRYVEPIFDKYASYYSFFREKIGEPKRVFYPCCHLDATPLKEFSNSEVVLMDIDEWVGKIMRNNNIKQFVEGDVLKYKPEKMFDLVIILSAGETSRDLTKYLSADGYALSNNHYRNAYQLSIDKDFEAVGKIKSNKNGMYLAKIDSSKLKPVYDNALDDVVHREKYEGIYIFKKIK